MRSIDSLPPAPTGNPEADVRALYQYLCNLVEQLNFIISQINKKLS